MIKPESKIEAVLLRLEKRMDAIENNIRDLNERIDNSNTDNDFRWPSGEENTVGESASEDNNELCDETENHPDLASREGITENILSNFDFARVEKVMKFLDWTWYQTGETPPSRQQIAELAKNLLVDAWSDLSSQAYDSEGWREWTVGTGGFVVWVCEGNIKQDYKRYASLKFVVEEWDVEP